VQEEAKLRNTAMAKETQEVNRAQRDVLEEESVLVMAKTKTTLHTKTLPTG